VEGPSARKGTWSRKGQGLTEDHTRPLPRRFSLAGVPGGDWETAVLRFRYPRPAGQGESPRGDLRSAPKEPLGPA